MSKILVVEREQRYVERIAEALSSQGWEVEGVEGRSAATKFVAEESASVVVVNVEVPEAPEMIRSFSRRGGGPGTVVLIPESGGNGLADLGADEVVRKPFTDQDIRLAVRRCLSGVAEGALASEAEDEVGIAAEEVEEVEEAEMANEVVQEGARLTSEDIFGDVVSELEEAIALGAMEEASTDGPVEEQPAEAVAVEPEAEIPELKIAEPVLEEKPESEPEPIESADEIAAAADEAVEPEEEVVAEEPPVEAVTGAEAATEVAEEDEELETAIFRDVELGAEAEDEEAEDLVAAPELEVAPDREVEEEDEEAAEELVETADESKLEEPVVEQAKPKVRVDPAAALEARIRAAALEGKRMADANVAAKSEESGGETESTDVLLRRALKGIDSKPAVPSEVAEEPESTEEEVDRLVGAVVGEDPERELSVEELTPDEAPVLEVLETSREEREQAERLARLKLIWAMILIGILGLVLFFAAREAGQWPIGGVPKAVEESTGAEADSSPGTIEAEDAGVAGPEGQGDGSVAADPEAQLRSELEAQRRQLQEEIANSQSSSGEGDGD